MRRTSVIICLLILFIPVSLFAQADDQWYLDKPIKDFTFSGLVTVAAKDLRAIVEPYIGKNFSLDMFWEVQGKLFALDEFESIEGNAEPADEARSAVIVDFVVKERPTVSEIALVGNSDVRSGDILDAIIVKKGDLVSLAKVKADESAIKSLYLEKGYTDITVTGRIDAKEADNTATVTFDITEGSQTTVKEVRFSGNLFASESTLKGLMKTKPPFFLIDTGVFEESKFEEDKKAILGYYTDHGYVDVQIERVDKDVQSEGGKNYLTLTIYVNEGQQWTFGGITFIGNSVFPTAKLEELITQKPGKTLSFQRLGNDYQNIQFMYYNNGYIFNRFDLVENPRDTQTNTISYTLTITELDKAHIENIIFKGNKKTREFVLRRELPFEEGDIFNRAKILEGIRNLYYLQYFSSIQPETPAGSAEGLMNLVVTVEEESKVDLKFGLSFSGETFPVSGYISWNDPNFNGTGETWGASLNISPITQSVSLNFIEPWMLGVRWSLGGSLSLGHSYMSGIPQDILAPIFTDDQSGIAAPDPYASWAEYQAAKLAQQGIPSQYLMSYDSIDLTLSVNTGYRWAIPIGYFGIMGGISSGIRWITYDPTLYRPFDKTVRDNLNNFNVIDKLATTIYLDGRDDPSKPMTGYQISQGLTYTGGFLFGNRQFNRTDSTLEGFLTVLNIPVSEDWSFQTVLAAHSSLSLLLPQYGYTEAGWGVTDHPIADPTDMLYMDGMNIGRGWGQRFGEALWDNKLELRVPISKEYFWAAAYFDAVGIWQHPSDLLAMNVNQFYFSFGLGLQLAIPQFPIRIYLGKEFQIVNGQVEWKKGQLAVGGFDFDFIISIHAPQTVGANSF
jgi:outer membrane protein insertion porin family